MDCIIQKKEENIGKQRNSSFELLRIVSMILIIAHHYSVHGGWVYDYNILSTNKLFIDLLSIGGKLGVNCFVVITGFFLVVLNLNLIIY